MLPLAKDQLKGASLQSVVETAVRHHFGEGYGPWSQVETVKYMSAQRRKTTKGFIDEMLGGEAILGFGIVTLACVVTLAIVLGRYVPINSSLYWWLATPTSIGIIGFSWYRIYDIFDGTYWQTNSLSPDGAYSRDFVTHSLPPAIMALSSTLKGLLNNPGFEVSFIGRDPILWVVYNGMRVPAVIWDELRDGSITLVPLPRR